jgi:sulfate transporter 4
MLGRLPGTNLYRNLKQYPEAQTIPGILIARVDAPFYFASVHVSHHTLRLMLAWHTSSQT